MLSSRGRCSFAARRKGSCCDGGSGGWGGEMDGFETCLRIDRLDLSEALPCDTHCDNCEGSGGVGVGGRPSKTVSFIGGTRCGCWYMICISRSTPERPSDLSKPTMGLYTPSG